MATNAVQILDQHGQPVRRGSAFFGASSEREFAHWNVSHGSADADLLPSLDTLRARNRDLGRNDGIAAGAFQTIVDNVIGTGPRLASLPDYRTLGRDKSWAREWSRSTEAKFREWWETTECDAAGQLTGAALSTQVFRSGLWNGEAIALPLWLPRRGSRWATRFQVVEPDRLSNPNNQSDTERLRAGIEIDQYGRPLAYHILKSHPGDWFYGYGMPVQQWERIEAETFWGRKRVVHVHDKERTGQTRGRPFLSPVIGQFKMLGQYLRTELQSAVVNAMVAAFITTPLPGDQVVQMLGGDINSDQYRQYLVDQREYTAQLKGAAIIPTLPGQDIKPFIPSHPNGALGPFVENLLRFMGAGLNLPYELLVKDFSKTNYSSARASLLEAWRFFNGRRRWFKDCWLAPVYSLWLEEAVNGGQVEAPGFYQNRYAYERANWIWPGRGWVDPVKEVEASHMRIEGGTSTLQIECAEQGLDWEEVIEQRQVEREALDEAGLMPEPGAGRVSPVMAARVAEDDRREESNAAA